MKNLQKFWNDLPKELKVSIYLLVAFFLSDFVAPLLGGLDNRFALMVANLVLVLGVEMQKRFKNKK